MKLAPPLITLGVGAVLAGGLVVANLVNTSRAGETVTPAAAAATQPSSETAPPAETAAASETASQSVTAVVSATPESTTAESTTAESTTAESTTAESTTAPAPAPAVTWTYKGPIDGTELSAAISVTGDQAVAYVCDGELVEFWLYGTAGDGTLDLAGAGGETIAATVTPELVGGIFTTAGGAWTVSAASAAWPDWAPPVTDGPGRA